MPDHERTLRIEWNPRWIRGTLGGRSVVDSRDTRFVWEVPYYPAWYFPAAHVHAELRPNGNDFVSSRRGPATGFDLVVDGTTVGDAGWRHPDSPVEELRALVRLRWEALDAWFEEDVEVFVHPRNPETRVDALTSSRHVRVRVGGEVVADSVRPTMLYETGLPPRYYLPKADVRMDLLTPTETTSACPYKGWARYWNVVIDEVVHPDIAWSYRTPLRESEGLAGLVCFYSERVDLEVDGVALDRPSTKFS